MSSEPNISYPRTQERWDTLTTCVNAIATIDAAIESLDASIGYANTDITALKKAVCAVKNGILSGNYVKLQ